ncbi:GNAT family N-acetyltransferase [soil metagenome]
MAADCRLTVTVREARDQAERDAAMAVRTRVFVGEQRVSGEEEFDGLDDEATHVVALDEKGVLATCRLRFIDFEGGPVCKLERMAVEKRARGLGVGARLVAGSERIAHERGTGRMVLHAQRPAEGFYAAQGYESEGGTFMEAEIPHVRMTKPL